MQDRLERFDAEFLSPGIERRRALLDAVQRGEVTDEVLPRDVLTVLLRNEDKVPLSHESLRREIAFYLLAGAHTSATAFTRVLHQVFTWLDANPADAGRALADRGFVQRCTHETIRLQPSSPVGMRWALADVRLSSGATIAAGDKVILDLAAANRDPAVFGADAEAFDPNRALAPGVNPWGLSFGMGMHACIGQDLAAGLVLDPDASSDQHLFGLVPVAVQAMLDRGARPVADDPPQMDTSTTRPYFARYPVTLAAP